MKGWRMKRPLLALAFLFIAFPALGQQTQMSNFVSGNGNATGTGATTIIASPSAGQRYYITSAQCGSPAAAAGVSRVTFNDDGGTVFVLANLLRMWSR